MFGRSALTKILKSWMAEGGSLSERLNAKKDLKVNTAAEARLVVAAIDHARANVARAEDVWDAKTELQTVMALLQSTGTEEAHQVLAAQGLPRLRAIVRDRLAAAQDQEERFPAFFALKLIGLFEQPEDVALIAEAAHAPLEPDSWWWTTVFYSLKHDNPCLPALLAALSDPLPPDFIRVAFLDGCNGLALGGHLDAHPFASPAGLAALEAWLSSTNDKESSYGNDAEDDRWRR